MASAVSASGHFQESAETTRRSLEDVEQEQAACHAFEQRSEDDQMADEQFDQVSHELADLPGVGTYHWFIEDDRVEWSPELVRLYGLRSGPDSEPGFIELVHPDDRLRVEAETSSFLAAGQSYAHEFRIIRPDGEVRVVHDRGVIERAPNGSPIRMRGINIDVTAQRSEHDEARREPFDRDFLKLSLDAAEQGAWDYDIASDTPKWDQKTHALFGQPFGARLSFERVIGEFVHPDDREKVKTAAHQAMDPAGNGKYVIEHRVVRHDGEIRWLAVQGRVLFEGAGPERRAVRMMGIVRDVTERRRTAEALTESRELLKMALDAGRMGIWRTDFARGVVECDELTSDLFGLEPGQKKHALDEFGRFVHPDDLRRVNATWDSLDVGQTFREEIRVRKSAEGERWIRGVGEKRPDGSEGKDIAIGLNWDITEQKHLEARLRESESLFRSMADNLPHIVWLHDAEGRQEFVNQTFCDYFGVTREEMRDQKWKVLVHPEDAEAYAAEFAACVRERRPFHAEVRVKNHAGEWRWLESWGLPRFDEARRYLGHVGTSADVTDRKHEEQLRQLLLEELDHRVKNTFALVQAIANQSLRGDRPIEEQRAAFVGRLRALASANDLLTRENWEKASLSELVTEAVFSTGMAADRFAVNGPEVVLQPRQAISLALALHELCTNAVKYGALSKDRGRVAVQWTVREDSPEHLRLLWSEHDGPAVSPPDGRGFGSVLLEQALTAELGAEVRMEFRPEGLCCTIEADLS
jgi:PAS domain S-box-containing protein